MLAKPMSVSYKNVTFRVTLFVSIALVDGAMNLSSYAATRNAPVNIALTKTSSPPKKFVSRSGNAMQNSSMVAAISGRAPESINVVGRGGAIAVQQRQPDSVTVISRQQLADRNIRQITDLIKVVPNLIAQSSFVGGAVNFGLRGVVFYDYTQVNTPAVLPYVDGIAYPISIMTTGVLFDMADVSVVKGPSGFTHGQATNGGEINFHTADPTFTPHAGLTEDFSSYDRNQITGYVSGQIIGRLTGRLAVQSTTGGGYQHNSEGASYGNANTQALRAKLKYDFCLLYTSPSPRD